MVLARTSLRGFLSQARKNLESALDKKENVTFVIGNESADLDSITSSIVYAYLRSVTSTPLHVPILNIPKADINLRPELLALLPRANIEAEHLITLDDLPELSQIESVLEPQNTRWFLVDHNSLQGKLGAVYSDRIVGVIDHHSDEGKVPKDTGSEPRIITTSGSCTSLIVGHCREAWDNLSSGTSSAGAVRAQGDSLSEDEALSSLWDAQVAQLALASVLVDTVNLKDEHKTTQHDRDAVTYLEAKINVCPQVSTGFDRDAFFDEVNDAKKDLGKMSLDDILRKDYKQWTEAGSNLGTSAVVQPLGYLKAKINENADPEAYQSLLSASTAFARERSLSVFSIMTAYEARDRGFAREVAVLGADEEGVKACERFLKTAREELQLEEVEKDVNGEVWYSSWKQGNLAASRKQVAPLLREAMASK